MSELEYWNPGLSCCNDRWEAAYAAFESPSQERIKFDKRFRRFGIDKLDKNLHIVDIFCGRGNGLSVLQSMGFRNLTGVDLSPDLLAAAPETVRRIVADCTELKFPAGSVDIFIVQGGLHHLPEIPEQLEACLGEVKRSLKSGGRFYVVEPWKTPFLAGVHLITKQSLSRKIVPKFNAFATMVEEEIITYEQWLNKPAEIEGAFDKYFEIKDKRVGMGKIELVAVKNP